MNSFPDEDISSLECLKGFKVSYQHLDGEEGVCLCMGCAENDVRVLPHPVTAHGQGKSPEQAQRMAVLNLMHNVGKLFPDLL